jgi:signal transduction histidine kinase
MGAGGWWHGLVVPTGDGPGMPTTTLRSWRTTVTALHAAFAIVVTLGAIDVARLGDQVPAGRAVGLTALGVLAVSYPFTGGAAISRCAPRRAVAYVVLLVLAIGAVSWAQPDALFVFFIAYPQVWFVLNEPRPGVFWTLLLFAASTTGVALHLAHEHASVFSAVADQLIGLVFSLLIGLWILRIIDQGGKFAAVAAELERKSAEVAALNHERGVLAERERLAREVHDTLAQGYTSIVMLTQAAAARLESAPSVARERLTLIEEVARENLQEARALVAALSPAPMDGADLRAALARLLDRFARETGLHVTLDLDDYPVGLRRDEEVVLLRAAQEALTNARRHAAAASVTLRLAREDGHVAVRIRDDGVGFSGAEFGTGLSGLRRRVEQAGGSLEVTSPRDGGTEVVARLGSS